MVDTGDNPKIAFVVVSRGWLERPRGTGWEVSSMPTLAVVLLLVVAQQNWPQNWLKKPVAVQKWWSAKVSEKTIENLREKRKKTWKWLQKTVEKSPKIAGNLWKSTKSSTQRRPGSFSCRASASSTAAMRLAATISTGSASCRQPRNDSWRIFT